MSLSFSLFRYNMVLLVAAVPLCAWGQAPSSCTQALYFYQQKQYSQALTLYDQCLMDHPDDGVMYYNRGKAWYELGHIDKALLDFEAAIKLTPSFVQSYYALSEHYLYKRDETNAVKWVNELLARYPNSATAYNLRGWIYFNFDRTALAFADFDKTISLDSLNASAYNNRGSARYKLQDIEAPSTGDLLLAKRDFLKALELDPTLANLHRNLGYMEFSLGNYTAADSLLSIAAIRNPNDAMVYYYRGLLFGKTSRFEEGIAQMDKALQHYANLGIAMLEKGRLQYSLKRHDQAITTYKSILATNSGLEALTYYEMAKAYAALLNRDVMLGTLKLAQKAGYFNKLKHKQAYFSEPVFKNYENWGPMKEFNKKLRELQ